MYFQKDEDDEENLSPNLSSEEFKELTDNNDKLNKSQSKTYKTDYKNAASAILEG